MGGQGWEENTTITGSQGVIEVLPRLEPLRYVRTELLEIGYYEEGPADGEVVPHFLSDLTGRSGQQAAIGADVIALLDALAIPRAVFAGFDWGGRAACVAAALWPERCAGLVCVNSYLIQDIKNAMTPIRQDLEAGLFDNPDFVEVVLHSYRHRLGFAPGYPEYDEIESELADLPTISAPTITLDGTADGNFPATDGAATAHHFTGPRVHQQVPGAGHNLPQEFPEEFSEAILADISQIRDRMVL